MTLQAAILSFSVYLFGIQRSQDTDELVRLAQPLPYLTKAFSMLGLDKDAVTKGHQLGTSSGEYNLLPCNTVSP